jgi:acyl-coenzyme A thioesterase 13
MSVSNEKLLADGYLNWGDADPFEDMIGPFFLKKSGDGTYRSAFVSERRHVNSSGMLHGGLLMSFADYSLFAIAKDSLNGPCVTVGFNSEFISAVGEGQLVESTGEVLRATRSLIFIRGTIFSGDKTLMSFSGVIKRLKGK